MIIAQVIGNVVATQKHRKYEGTKLLVIQPLDLDGSPRGDAMMAVDSISTQAGVGDKVLVVLEGWSASYAVRREQAPIDAAIVGVIDHITVKREK